MKVGTPETHLNEMFSWKDNWDDHGCRKPKKNSIRMAIRVLRSLRKNLLNSEYKWVDPNITGGNAGEVVFEWWHGNHKITLFIEKFKISILEVYHSPLNDPQCRNLVFKEIEMYPREFETEGYLWFTNCKNHALFRQSWRRLYKINID